MAELDPSPEVLQERLESVRERVARAAARAARSPEEIKIIAISKTHPVALMQAALEAGVAHLGENRVQEAEAKINELGREAAQWHLVGHLQTNKARRAVRLFDCIHSLDSAGLATRLERICEEEQLERLPVLVQVDLAHEATKSGITQDELPLLVQALRECSRLRFVGLMTVPPFFDNPEEVRPYFGRLRGLRDELQSEGAFGDLPGELSMGMTHDFEVAVEEGATMVRIGTAIFGERANAPLAEA